MLYKTQSHHSPIVIADFGIAKHLEYDIPTPASPDSQTPSGPQTNTSNPVDHVEKKAEGEEGGEKEEREGGVDSFAGSFGYAAPEVLLGLRHGLKVDCWSIGYVPFYLVHSYIYRT